MENNWTTIGEISEIFDGPHATPKKTDIGPYFLSISSLVNGSLDLSKSAHLSDADFEKWTKRVTPQPGDLLFSYETRLGEAALMPEGIKACLGRRMGLLRLNQEKVIPRYMLYAYLSPDFQSEIRRRTNYGATVERIALKELPIFPIRIPSLTKQRTIAHILGTLDDKIELNRQMNETLEAMAQALFKSWFVDFDPVIDNALLAGKAIPEPLKERAEIRQAQLDSGKAKTNSDINDLFPSEFEFTEELGWIPKGWGNAVLGDVLVRRNEMIKAGKETQELRYVPIDCITSKSLFLSESKDGEEAKTSLTKFYKKDIIFGAMRPYFHKVCIAPFDGTTRSTAFVLKPKFAFDYSFALMQLYQDSTIAIATSESVGSTIPYAKWDGSMADIPICMPSEELRRLFDSIVSPSFNKIADTYFSNETLANLRDTLLPKLMSGELRIADAEKLVVDI